MPLSLRGLSAFAVSALFCVTANSQSANDVSQPPAILPLQSEAAPKLIAYPPLAEPLARGVVIVQYRAENIRIMPVFGKEAADVSPRLGHLHVTLDGSPGTWAHTSGDPIIVVGLKPGTHRMLLDVADPTHKILTSTEVIFTVPQQRPMEPAMN
ncbi:hypothetical protein EA796_01780 [Pseudomonas sp. AOB-7]|jgi:hypothetical protein|uniref:DUF6130 family protein n=1 Tax=unclassified Pseudomonas TaxID=196821 RepID=UPI0004CFAF78|nr:MULTISPECIES: DUF6130 family protein [unclassified Pseudomonas]RMH86587.1 hypothetical protein EA796_01780 [Pseudomonas sp. AOB-7]